SRSTGTRPSTASTPTSASCNPRRHGVAMRDLEPESEREIVVSRVIDGPRALVFEVFSDSGHLGQWWGPNGFTLTTHAFEFDVGGVWDYTMHGPDGTDYPNWVEW